MTELRIKPKEECRYDILTLGEIMLRFDPGENRIHTARSFRVWEGGGEYNVARALRRCFGLRAAVVTAFADNPVGRLLEDLILQGGVDTSFIKWVPYDGLGRAVRNGLNFLERGFGIRGALGCSDRAYTAVSQLQRGEIDWERIFSLGVRWFHTGGIFAALSETTPEVLEEAMQAAKKYGTIISYDLNYRASLWKLRGGEKKAQEVNKKLAPYVDVMLGNEEDFTACLGIRSELVDKDFRELNVEGFKQIIRQTSSLYPNFKVIATTLRGVKTATLNDWGAVSWTGGKFYESKFRPGLEILDRVGGGDSFASGLIYGLMEKSDPQVAVEYGAVHGALAMTTPGDTSMATLKEVEKIVYGRGARVER